MRPNTNCALITYLPYLGRYIFLQNNMFIISQDQDANCDKMLSPLGTQMNVKS